MIRDDEPSRDLAALVVPRAGWLVATGDRYEPYQLVDADGVAVVAVTAYFRDLLAAGRAESTVRSYGMDLLRWFRFLWAGTGVVWDQATRVEARDFCRWLQVMGKQSRPHWRAGDGAGALAALAGKAYAPSVRAHSETVLRAFYDFHLDAGSGPVINPFPLDRPRGGGRTRTTIRWRPTVTSAAGCIGRGCLTGSLVVSRTASSTRSGPRRRNAEVIVTELNLFLRGWAGYFRYGNSARVLGQVGNYALVRHGAAA